MSKTSKETMRNDEIKVLNIMEQHAKENIGEIAKKCDCSPQKVARIIKNLEQRKIIWGYSAIADGTLRDFKHFVLLAKRNTVPFDASFKKELIFEKLDDYHPFTAKVEDIFLTHGSLDAVVTLYAPNLIDAKNLVEEISKRIGKYFREYILLETLFPIRKQGLKNPNIEKLVEYL